MAVCSSLMAGRFLRNLSLSFFPSLSPPPTISPSFAAPAPYLCIHGRSLSSRRCSKASALCRHRE
nr:MAG TPA: hypothetical protein [Caudoviricetes sp.]